MAYYKDKSRIRRKWSLEDKVFFCSLLLVPTRYGIPKTVSEVAKEYAIAPRMLYEWLEIYKSFGREGFRPEKRNVINSKSKDHELRSEIFHLSLINPDWSALELIKHLSCNKTISVPTVQKILKDENCESLKKRYIATERALTNKEIIVSQRVMNKLLTNNPYLYLYEINKEVNGIIYLIKLLPLKNYIPRANGYLILGLETKSLFTHSVYWDGVDFTVATKFIYDLPDLFGGKHVDHVYIKFDDHRLLKKLVNEIDRTDVKLLSNSYKFNTKLIFKKVFTPTIANLRLNLFKNYQFDDIESLHQDFYHYFVHDISSQYIHGYPCFGQPKYHMHKNNLKNMEFEPIKQSISPG